MATEVQEMRNKLRMVREERATFAAAFGPDNIPTEDDERKLDAMMNGEADLEAEIKRLERFETARAGDRPARRRRAIESREGRPSRPKLLKTFGAHFTESEQFRAALASVHRPASSPTAANSRWARSPSGLTDMGSGMRADADHGGSVDVGRRVRHHGPLPRASADARPAADDRILDLIRILQTSSDLVEYVAQTSRTNNADTVAEATAPATASGVQAGIGVYVRGPQRAVVTIANWMPCHTAGRGDVPQLRGYIDTELRDNLREALANKVLNGATPGTDITGILQTSGRRRRPGRPTSSRPRARRGRRFEHVGRTTPTGYVMNPSRLGSDRPPAGQRGALLLRRAGRGRHAEPLGPPGRRGRKRAGGRRSMRQFQQGDHVGSRAGRDIRQRFSR
jgi:hypothetical protein